MASSPRLAPLFVVSGLVGGAGRAAPVPPPELAQVQLRALDHRSIDATVDPDGALMQALTADDFLLTAQDGAWTGRPEFLASLRQQAQQAGASHSQVELRLYGPVALVQGVFMARAGAAAPRVRYTDVWVWNGANWQLVSVQNTALHDTVVAQRRKGSAQQYAAWTSHDPAGDDLQVLTALNASYVQAFRDADVAWYEAHLAPDYTVVSGDGTYEDRAAALADFGVPYFATSMRSFPLDKVRLRRFADVALIHAENAYERKDGRKGVNRYTDIWHKADGRWRCVAAHITVHKAPS